MGVSRRAYAAHRKERGLPGGTHTAVNKAIETGRIKVLADGSIDPAAADAQWNLATNPALQRPTEAITQGIERARDNPEAEEQRPVSQGALDAVREGSAEGLTYTRARAAKEAVMAQLAQIRLKKERSLLVDRAACKADVYDLARKERDHWLQLPARAAANLAAEFEVDAHAMEMALDRLIRGHLGLLIEARIEILEPPKQL